ncbi:hypothetical protein N9E51_01610 [Alphaproteobacteria bacterium]|nr:hypothetical protein [Alphaproteobacteria bacterium]
MKESKFTQSVDNLQVIRPFGPTIAKVQMPENLVQKLNCYVDQTIKDEKL